MKITFSRASLESRQPKQLKPKVEIIREEFVVNDSVEGQIST